MITSIQTFMNQYLFSISTTVI